MRTKYCGKIKISDIDKEIILCGWVNKTRNLGKFIFIDMRDKTGIVQILFHPKYKLAFEKAKKLKNEFCIKIIGIVKKRIKENKNIITGKIEILAHELIIFNTSLPLPININDFNEDIMRLKYRYLDLRSFKMIHNLTIKNKILHIIHKFMKKNHFLNIETPILTKSTPEGAKDYLIASRIHKKKYYALPQSPQLFKQILMISGIDKYYQIAKCFRDEDLRSDRQPEFTQIDLEASFITSKKIMNIIECLIIKLWKKIINHNIKKIPIISFKESMEKYRTDKPDLRNPLKFINLKHKKLYNQKQDSYNTHNTQSNALLIPKGTYKLNNEKINILNKIFQKYQEIQYIYIHIINLKNKEYKVFNSKKHKECNLTYILKNIISKNGDMILIMSGNNDILNCISDIIRMKIGKLINKINIHKWKPVWIINFPMFIKNKFGQLSSVHHPFTAPKNINIQQLKKQPELIISDSYDLVINGYEIGGGSVRIHDRKIQEIILKLLNINFSHENDSLYFFVNALKYGTPPHAGIALGLDRITMLLTKSNNIKDVIAFPKTNSANCIMTGAPSQQKY